MPRLLFVDDQNDICEVIEAFMRAHGFGIVTANHGAAAQRLLESEPFDLVILDAVLPGVPGAALAQAARARGIPVLMISGNPKVINGTGQDGPHPFLAKPFRLAELEMAVRAALDAAAASEPPSAAVPR